MNNWRNSARGIGILVLALFLILYGFQILVGLAIPEWVGALMAILAGILLLVGR